MEIQFFFLLVLFLGCAKALTIGGYSRWRPVPGSTSSVVLETSAAFGDTTCQLELLSTPSWENCAGCTLLGFLSTGTCIQQDSDKSWSVAYASDTYPLTESTATPRLTYTESFPSVTRSLSTLIDTRARSDTGSVNSPPITVLRPVITVNSGCARDIPISVHDKDGDDVKCRFVTANCGDYCTTIPNTFISLNESTCVLTYTGAGSAGAADVVVNVAIEDFPTSDITVGGTVVTTSERLSFVNLQFVVRIGAALADCTALPSVAELTGSAITTVTSGDVYSQTVSVTSTQTVTKITGFGLHDLTSSSITSSSDVYSSTFSWTATSASVGDNTVCYTAEIADGTESNQQCHVVRVAEPPAETTVPADPTTAAIATTAAATTIATTVAETTTATEAVITTAEVNPCLTANGGCSDTCNWSSGTTVTCSCNNSCWHLAADGKHCIPEVSFLCSEGQARISVDKCASAGVISINNIDPTSAAIPLACRPTDNSTHTNFQYALNQCGSNITDTGDAIQYGNTVRFWTMNTGDTVTRGVGYDVSVSCSFPKFNNLSSLFDPLDSFVNFLAVPGLGYFTFDFKFYTDSNFDAAYTIEPVHYRLNSDVYFAIEASGGSGVRLFTETCTAHPDIPDTPERYTLIDNGCMKDFTMQSHTSPNPMHNWFSVKAFRFVDSLPGITNETNVAIRCFVVVCVDEPTKSTRCSRGCVTSSARRRREVEHSERMKRQTKVVKLNESIDDVFESVAHLVASVNFQLDLKDEGSTLDWKWILLVVAASLGALIALLSCCCCWWLFPAFRRRRRRSKEEKEDGLDNDSLDLPKWLQTKASGQ